MPKKQITAPENTSVIYARYSSLNQREESIDAQVRACQEYAQRNGLQIVDVYADSAKTGTNVERENFQRMIEDSAKGKFRYIIIHKLDRFSRDKYDSVTYKRKLKMNGVILRSVLENLDGSPESLILESMLEGMAAYYSQNLSRECLKGLLENGHKCLHNGGIPPLGYDVDKATRTYVINEQEAEIVRDIFYQYAGGTGYNQILAYLNSQGYRTKRGNAFGKNSLHDLLKNRKYTGVYTFNLRLEKSVSGVHNSQFKPEDEWICIEGGMPIIVDSETFDKVQAKMAYNKRNAGRFKTRRVYLLASLIRCGECNSAMYGKSHIDGRHGREYLSYACSGRKYKRICNNKEIRREYIEAYVLRQLEVNLFSEHSIRKLSLMLSDYSRKERAKNTSELNSALQILEGINRKIERIIQLVSESGISIDTVKEDLKRLEGEKRETEANIQGLQVSGAPVLSEEVLSGMIHKSREAVKAGNMAECQRVLENYIETIFVYRDRVEVKFKISVPDEGNDILVPLTVEGRMAEVKASYGRGF